MEQANKRSKWTEEQAQAISADRCNLLVSAAAGAGKTAVLVERIIRKITDIDNPVDIDRLLVVTFTNAAAAEMRDRIGAALSKVLEAARKDDTKYVKNLQRQLALLGKASITTIHSFCLDVIRNNFHRIDLDASFRIADDTEALLLQMEVLEELIEQKYEPENCTEEFLELVECYGGGRDDKKLADLVLTVYEFIESHPWPEIWLRDAVEAFNPEKEADFGRTKWAKILMKSIRMEILGMRSALEAAAEAAEKAEGLSPYGMVLREDCLKVDALLGACGEEGNWDELYKEFAGIEFARLPRCGKEADEAVREQVKGIRDDVRSRINKLKKELAASDSEELARDMKQIYPVMKSLGSLVLEFGEKYRERKKQKNVIDFNDLEHYCLEVLTSRDEKGGIVPTQAALELRERFEEIYIDEYQDSNLTQEVILNTVSREESGEPNIFMVGDVKQSIYRFRQAKPEIFISKLKTYSGEPASKYRRILLNKNFRSRPAIINGVNYLFGQIMSEGLGEIDYTEEEALYPGAVFEAFEERPDCAGGPVELHIIDSREAVEKAAEDEYDRSGERAEEDLIPETDEIEDQPDSIQCEARVAAARIRELTSGNGLMVVDRDTGKYRPARFSDIVILMRATRNWADVFAEELSLQGIPVYTDTGIGYFKTIEISTILSLLQIIDNPLQDIPMLSVLRSPIGGFDAEELIDIRIFDREAPFYEAMAKAAAEGGELGEKTAEFLERLDRWREKALYLSTDELIWYLYNETGYYSFVGAMPGGIKRQANLRLLFDKARQYEESSFKGLFNFINFINRLKGSQGDMGSAKTLGENDNVVRIMSIHKSKGLEFPIVFLCGTGKGFNLADVSKSILLHHELGIGPDFIDPRRRIWYPSIFKLALKHKIRLENLSEEMRILYVALTRAKEKLIIIGTVNDPAQNASRWNSGGNSRRVPEYDILRGKSFMDWICTALMRHPSKPLAEKLGVEPSCLYQGDEASQWNVRLWDRAELLKAVNPEEKRDEKPGEEAVPALSEAAAEADNELIKRLEWKYPYSAYERLPVKVTVTELKRYFESETAMEYDGQEVPGIRRKPGFLEDTGEMSAAEKGSLMHFVLQHLDFKGDVSEAGIRRQVSAMVAAGLLTEVQAHNVNIRRIEAFMGSNLGRRMANAEKLYRESPFTMEVKCSEVFGSMEDGDSGEETVVIQGIIDCWFEEEGKLVLVDYKTDYIPKGETEEIKERYRTQIEYYARALRQITGKDIKGKYIYLFWNGEILEY